MCIRDSISDERLIDALFNAGAIGYLAMRNATVAGAVGGCQAEVGIASAMAASAAVELMGGKPEQCLDAVSYTHLDVYKRQLQRCRIRLLAADTHAHAALVACGLLALKAKHI